MSDTSQVTDFSDIYTDIMNRVRVDTSGAVSTAHAKRFANIALQDMHIGNAEKMPWAERHQTLVTQPKYTTGTIVATKGSTTITGTGTAWDTANDLGRNNMRVGGKIVIAGGVDVHEITAIASDTSATITPMFVQDTVSGETYVYFEDEYALHADYLRPFDMQFFDQDSEISLMDRREFRSRYPRNKTPGKPLVATVFDRAFSGDTTAVRRVAFKNPPDKGFLLPYNFITNKLAVTAAGVEQTGLINDTDEPIVPLRYRHAITYHALYHWYRDKKNDSRSQAAKLEYMDIMQRIMADTEIGGARPKFKPATAGYMSRSRSPYRRQTGRHVTGDRFDRMK